jgi:hypothetical protein
MPRTAQVRASQALENGAPLWREDVWHAAPCDGPTQLLLTGTGVLVGKEATVDQEPGVVVDDEEQPGAHGGIDLRVRHIWPDQHVGDPALVRAVRLVAAEDLRLCLEGLSVKATAAQLSTDRPLGDCYPVAVIQDRRDLGGRSARELEAQRCRFIEQLRVGPHRPGVGPLGGLEGVKAAGAPCPYPSVDRPA